ncbi:hypothetical protein C8R48DRAFT_674646 [Suillus tomentosus]|nr:hypothetical protein C8R48DRAFT_674646 [Suillus tomentosus]
MATVQIKVHIQTLRALPKMAVQNFLTAVLLGNTFESPHIQKCSSHIGSPSPSSPPSLSPRGSVAESATSETDDDSVFPWTPDSKHSGGRSDIDDSTTSGKFDDKFLKHLDVLGPQMFGLVVHLQEAVRERQRMRLFTTYWEVEENSRRGALLRFLYKDAEKDFSGTERDAHHLDGQSLGSHGPDKNSDVTGDSLATG